MSTPFNSITSMHKLTQLLHLLFGKNTFSSVPKADGQHFEVPSLQQVRGAFAKESSFKDEDFDWNKSFRNHRKHNLCLAAPSPLEHNTAILYLAWGPIGLSF
jgi:hypothetical protein